ncbi:MAG: methyltransferase domain-containing protein [Myxococcaceae bacterium]|nr:methyltransferase domain-containing protein [Myxococcaceae bacterium]
MELAALESPPDWTEVFGFDGPIELELGSGKGGHALEYAARHPKVRYVAFEWRKKYARDAQARADQAGLRNVRFIEADARRVVPKIFAPGSLSWIRLQFPDPWWKRAHGHRALLQGEFVKVLFDLLQPGGRFDLRTDVHDRAVKMLATLEAAGFVNPLGAGVFHPYDPEEVPSSRERRYLERNEPVYRARLVKP